MIDKTELLSSTLDKIFPSQVLSVVHKLKIIDDQIQWLDLIEGQSHEQYFLYVFYLPIIKKHKIVSVNLKKDEKLPSLQRYFNYANVFENKYLNSIHLKYHPKPKAQETINPNLHESPFSHQLYDEVLLSNESFYSQNKFTGVIRLCGQKISSSELQLDSVDNNLNREQKILEMMLIEKSKNCQIPEKAQALRMIILEKERIQNHFQLLQNFFARLNFIKVTNVISSLRQEIDNLFSSWDSDTEIVKLGGISVDLPVGLHTFISNKIPNITAELNDLTDFIFSHHSLNEFLNYPVLGNESALFTQNGAMLRSLGYNFDIRRTHSMYFYSEIDFHVSVGENGQVIDLLLVYFSEINQSLKIIKQILENLPLGGISTELNLDDVGHEIELLQLESTYGQVISFMFEGKVFHVQAPKSRLLSGLNNLLVGHDYERMPVIMSLLGV